MSVSLGACFEIEPSVAPCTVDQPVVPSGEFDDTILYVRLGRFFVLFPNLCYPIFVRCGVVHQPFLQIPPVVFRWGIPFWSLWVSQIFPYHVSNFSQDVDGESALFDGGFDLVKIKSCWPEVAPSYQFCIFLDTLIYHA